MLDDDVQESKNKSNLDSGAVLRKYKRHQLVKTATTKTRRRNCVRQRRRNAFNKSREGLKARSRLPPGAAAVGEHRREMCLTA